MDTSNILPKSKTITLDMITHKIRSREHAIDFAQNECNL